MSRLARLSLPAALLFTLTAAAQVPAATGTVSGTITAGDTQRPMRFAKVTLTPVKSDAPDTKGMSDKALKDDPAAAMKLLSSMMGSVTMLLGQTGLDGTYSIADVAPGDYYLIPSAPGYVSPAAAAGAAAGPSASEKEKMAGVPIVHVEANHTTRGDASLPRGAALTGTVVFDDGSPAAGVVVQFEQAAKADAKSAKKNSAGDDDDDDLSGFGSAMAMNMAGGLIIATTDDRGRFRLAGLPSGDYILNATVTLGTSFSMRNGVMDMGAARRISPLTVYAPGTLHEKDAAKITAHVGEERGDIEIKVDLTAMRTVHGRVASAVDHHAINSGTITMTDTADKTLKRTGSVEKDGTFVVSYVPAGTWKLEVSDGADTEPSKKKSATAIIRFDTPHTLRSYEEGSTTVIVAASDVTGVNVELKESKTVKKDLDMNDLLNSAPKAKE